MISYQLGKIYQLVCNTTGKVYIGSTCEPTLAKRLVNHRTAFKRYQNGLCGFTTSFLILENENYEIILIENFPCNSKDELHARERHFIENLDVVNKNIPNRTVKEYKELQKEYNILNKDILTEYQTQYRKNNREEINKYYTEEFYFHNRKSILKQKKEYYELNKGKKKEYQKHYYTENKEIVKEKEKHYRTENKDKIKQYQADNKEALKEYQKQYYQSKKALKTAETA